MEVWFFFGFNG